MKIWIVLPFLAVAGLCRAQEPAPTTPITTGPPEGTALTPVMAYAPVGPRAGEEFDAAAAIGDGPGALLFIHELTRNGLPVMRAIDQIGAEFALLGFASHTLLMSDDRTSAEGKVQAVNGSLKLHNPIALCLDGLDGPGNYALNRKAVLSLIILKDGKVHKSIAFTDVNAEDAKLVRELIIEVAGEIPSDPAELRQLAAARVPQDAGQLRELAIDQTLEIQNLRLEVARLKEQAAANRMDAGAMTRERPARPPAPAAADPGAPEPEPAPKPDRHGKPPEDPELNTLLRAFIRQDNDKATVDEVYASITARGAENDELGGQVIEMFKLMLSYRDRYGTPDAQVLAESFLKEHDKP